MQALHGAKDPVVERHRVAHHAPARQIAVVALDHSRTQLRHGDVAPPLAERRRLSSLYHGFDCFCNCLQKTIAKNCPEKFLGTLLQ